MPLQKHRCALHAAALMGHGEIVEALINGGASVNARDDVSRIPGELMAMFSWGVEGGAEWGDCPSLCRADVFRPRRRHPLESWRGSHSPRRCERSNVSGPCGQYRLTRITVVRSWATWRYMLRCAALKR